MKNPMISWLIFISVLFFLCYCNSSAVSLSDEVVEKLRNEGRLEECVQRANLARAKGVWQPNPYPPSVGHGKGLSAQVESLSAVVLLVDFNDHVHIKDSSEFYPFLFSQGTYPTGSMRDFYWENSYQRFDLCGTVCGWIRMPQSYSYYVNNDYGFGSYPTNAQRLVEDAVNAANPYINFADFDKDGDGWVDGLFVVHAGQGAEQTGSLDDIWSHSWSTSYVMNVDGVQISSYAMEPEVRHGDTLVDVGVFCHEFGHVLGLPDLYDYDYSSRGIGRWSLMAYGCWANQGHTPTHIDAWGKAQLGWIEIDTITSNQTNLQILQIETNPKAYRLWTNGATGAEYFLVENRHKTKFDSYMDGEGLLIYHVDDYAYGNDEEWCPGYPPYQHYHIALEQADGLFNLEGCYGPNNKGDGGDPFPGDSNRFAFNDTTIPGSRDYYDNSTQVSVLNISSSDSVMYADLNVIWSGYVSGDANGNGRIELGDIVYLINYIFRSGPAPQPLAAGDATCNGAVELGDVVYLISYLYRSGPTPCS